METVVMLRLFRARGTIELDPFAFWPGAASCIAGLGGREAAVSPETAFHTIYLPLSTGSVAIELLFQGLVASSGTLIIELMAIGRLTDIAKVQSRWKVSLTKLASAGGKYTLSFLAKEGAQYALHGLVAGGSDAAAASLSIHTDGKPTHAVFARKLADARRKIFARRSHSDGLVVDQPATLAVPRSQMCTATQFGEPDYSRWLAIMHRPMHRHRKQWEYVFIARTLEVGGVLTPGARGLGFGCGIEPLPAAFAAHGAFVTASDLAPDDTRAHDWRETNQHSLNLEALSDPQICDPDLFRDRVTLAAIDMNAIPTAQRDYDFCWSSCSLEHLGSIEAGLRFIERSLDTLRPGGIAVHTTEFNLTSDRKTLDHAGTVLFRRRDIERLARKLVAAGHHVAPITFDQGDQPEDMHVDTPPYSPDDHYKLALGRYVTTSFGLTVRKAALALELVH